MIIRRNYPSDYHLINNGGQRITTGGPVYLLEGDHAGGIFYNEDDAYGSGDNGSIYTPNVLRSCISRVRCASIRFIASDSFMEKL